MSIYKFLKPAIAKLFLENLGLKASAPADFNDPFDAYPISSMASPQEVEEKAKAMAKKLMNTGTYTQEDADKYSLQFINKQSKEEQIQFDEIVRQFTYRIVCFTRSSRHPLLWTHYGENHTGVVIEFDDEHPFFRGRLKSVIYLAERPVLTIEDMRLVTQNMRNPEFPIPSFFRIKALEWAYEQEVRFFESITTARDLTQDNGKWILTVPADTIKSITFGLLFGSPEIAETSRDILQRLSAVEASNQIKIPLFSMRRSASEYRLDKQPIKLNQLGV